MMGGGGPNGNMQGPADDARVEGCFNHFDAQAEVPLDPSIVGVHNNLRCQAACAAQGYALAATRSNPLGCLCGNDYPSPFHQMDVGKCDAPCSPDKATCFLFTCCGSQDGKLFIVSFTGKQNILLQVLRQLAFDYRYTSPTFRNKIEEAFVDASALQVVSINDNNNEAMYMVAGGGGGGGGGGIGNGKGLLCPSPWITFQNACYRLHWAQPMDFDAAQHVCQEEDGGGACLVVPESAQENEILAQLQAGCQGWLGIRRSPPGQEKGNQRPAPYQNWTTAAAAATPSTTSECAQLRPDGGWVSRPCKLHDQDNDDDEDYESRHGGSCFICKRMLLTAADHTHMEAVSLVPSSSSLPSETWRLLPVVPPDPDHFVVQIQHEPSHQLLACSPEHDGLELVPPSNDAATCTRATFVVEVNQENGCFTLRQQCRVVAVVENDRQGGSGRRLVCMEQQDQQQQQIKNGAAAAGTVATFRPTCMLRVFAQRYLRLSVVTLSEDLHHRGLRECSVAAYDTSPTTTSYRCRPLSGESRVGAAAQGDELWLEQQALLIGDESRWLRPRVPLPFGRLRCINEHPKQSAICTIAYGQGITIARALTVEWNYIIFDTVTKRKNVEVRLETSFRTPGFSRGGGAAAAGDGAGGGGEGDGEEDGEDQSNEFTTSFSALKELANDFTALYNNIYEIAVVHAYVETRNWQMTLLAKPLTSYSVQFWLETVYLTYRWRALFQARGSFRVFYFDQPIGSHHAIGDLSNYDDIFFYVFGRYDFPLEGSLIATINNRGEERWPLALPTISIVEDDRGGGF